MGGLTLRQSQTFDTGCSDLVRPSVLERRVVETAPMTLDLPTLSALRSRPDDLDAFRVLADRLQAEGDPRGELISLQLSGHAKRVDRHLAMHARTLLGRLFTHQSSLSLEWGAGFIRQATVSSNEGRERAYRSDGRVQVGGTVRKPFAWLTGELLALESAALLEWLTLSLATSSRTQALFAEAVEQVAVHAPPTLRRLTLRREPPERRNWPWDEELNDEPCGGFPHRREVALHGRLLTLEADELSLLEQAHAVLRDGG